MMKPHRSVLLVAVAVAVAVALALAGCGGGGASGTGGQAVVPGPVSPEQLAQVTLKIGDQKGTAQQTLLKAAGQLDDVPYHVQWSTFTSGPPMLEAVNAGAVDVGQVGNTPPIFAAAAGGAISIVGALRSTVGDVVLVPKGSAVATLADLAGKTIAVAKGSSANGTLLNALAVAGLKPTDVTISYLQPGDAYAAFNQGGVAAWVVWEPYATEATQNLGARELVSGSDALHGTGPASGTPLSNGLAMLVANRAALSDPGRNAAIADYVARVGKANQWAAAHLDQWAGLYSQQTGVAPAIAKAAAPRLAVNPVALDDSVVTSEQRLADAFASAGLIPDRVEMASFIDRRYNQAVPAGKPGQ